MKQESIFLKKINNHHAQKDISEALEQFHSSKNLSEAHRAILTKIASLWLSQIGVSGKDYYDKLKSKTSEESYNTIRSRQNS